MINNPRPFSPLRLALKALALAALALVAFIYFTKISAEFKAEFPDKQVMRQVGDSLAADAAKAAPKHTQEAQ